MATRRQIEANRRNARQSTGPRTTEGKNRSRWNALEHGLASVHTVLPHEDPVEFHRMRAELIESWQPINAQELMLVDHIAQGNWRMLRSQRIENAIFDAQIRSAKRRHGLDQCPDPTDDTAIAVCFSDPDNETAYNVLFRYDARAQSTYYRALDRLQKLQSDRKRRAERAERARGAGNQPVTHSVYESSAELASFGAGIECVPPAPVEKDVESDSCRCHPVPQPDATPCLLPERVRLTHSIHESSAESASFGAGTEPVPPAQITAETPAAPITTRIKKDVEPDHHRRHPDPQPDETLFLRPERTRDFREPRPGNL